jgi:hypothetical protein
VAAMHIRFHFDLGLYFKVFLKLNCPFGSRLKGTPKKPFKKPITIN